MVKLIFKQTAEINGKVYAVGEHDFPGKISELAGWFFNALVADGSIVIVESTEEAPAVDVAPEIVADTNSEPAADEAPAKRGRKAKAKN